ncbi:Cytochrome C oxidase, cbb3-type, subunit III [Enhydrobacter aerosaccus]|uniref:Cytochrome C oxidase, cbb3-type, subunit III n=1 Tax=Enhydrobacter aerosaccus TaxID=225324 RepID=A0A1T4R0Z9_9HYPH|nr:cytochrome c [Enhydrobacter aerosaccus]SKA09732.1 Cytochrome C oxidase, cbb3-type, subunit III [Enhydrobacter aerosaccus]
MHRSVGPALGIVLALTTTVHAQDVVNGEALARRWCVSCHIVSADARTGQANGLPSFPTLAKAPQTTETSLRRAMTAGHSRMPDFSLTKQEQDNLIAYIFSLRSR